MLINQRLFLALILLLGLSRCTSIKGVSSYSSSALSGVEKYEDVGYSFVHACKDQCRLDAMDSFTIRRTEECSCVIYKTADSVTDVLYNAVKKYFEALSKLSDKDLGKYEFSPLKKTLTSGDYGKIKITAADESAFGSLAGLLTNAYRAQKIKGYITQANAPLQILLAKLEIILKTNLAGEIDFRKEELYAYYNELRRSSTLNDYDKGRAVNDYYAALQGADDEQAQIKSLARAFKTIAEGHQKLYDNRDALTSANVKAIAAQYSDDIKAIIADINKHKK